MAKKGGVTGGIKLARYLKQKRRQVENLTNERTFDVGFNDPSIAALAGTHEFGRGDIPERPAFRASKPALRSSVEFHARKVARTMARPDSRSDQVEARIQATVQAAVGALKQSYLRFEGTPLSERQRQRKAGTPFADTELQGAEGPRLISHINAVEKKD